MALTTWNIDASHTGVSFIARHMIITKVRGGFSSFSGALKLDEEDLTKSSVEVSIDAASIDSKEPKRDGHLKSPDFLDVEKYPTITFKSTKVTADGPQLLVEGLLTIHGVTKPVTLKAEKEGAGKDPWGNERIAFTAKTSIIREEFGLKWNQVLEAGGVLVSSKIEIELDVQAIKAAA
jgi:polyisoprenoid-binding protein YceI